MTYAVTPGGPQGVGQILAAVPGSNPATGAYNYMTHDNIRSTRGVFDQSKAMAGEFAFTPYGGAHTSHGDSAFRLFTGKPYDTASGMYFFPYRYYNDHIGRWISRDPLGMIDGPNVYAYVNIRVVNYSDRLGLSILGDIRDKIGDLWDRFRKFSKGCFMQCMQFNTGCLKGNAASIITIIMCLATGNPVICLFAIGIGAAVVAAAFLCFNDCRSRKGRDHWSEKRCPALKC